MERQETAVKQTAKQPAAAQEGTRPGRVYLANADIGESRDAVWLDVDIPGVDEKNLEVELEDGVLAIRARVDLSEYQDLTPVYTEYNVGDFERRFRVSSRIDSKGIEARIENGVLHLVLPKAQEARSRTIEIRGA